MKVLKKVEKQLEELQFQDHEPFMKAKAHKAWLMLPRNEEFNKGLKREFKKWH